MKKYFAIFFAATLTSCSSFYMEEFDTPVHEGVKNYSLTDLERSIIEMPGDEQDVLMGLPGMIAGESYEPKVNSGSKVWVCERVNANGDIELGHYKIFGEERK